MEIAERIRGLVAPLVAEVDAELYDVEFTGGTLRITVDRPGGVDMGVIGSLTRAVSRLLDETDPIPGQFTLEVSSPGLERPLRIPEHFARAVGEVIAVKTRPGTEGDRRLTGRVVAADDESVTIAPDAADAAPRRLLIDDLERARTVFEWGPAPKPGGPKSSPSAKQKKAAKS
ncbi:MAG TPA: ribosome maturation factor RimP [Aquihabitans sp.]|jgi:ribosome maturation factor RimP|nr:ribosome maturation factor RimP [Aquihabitans sp.]